MGLHPGNRLAKSMEKSPLKPVPSGSFPSPMVAVKGAPVVAVIMLPSCQPPAKFDKITESVCGEGMFHTNVAVNICRISKSQAPTRADLTSNSGTAMEFRYVSPVTGAELV